MLREFRDFINRGNFIDIAVGFVMGAAFGAVVSTFTSRLVTPLVGMVVHVDFDDWGRFGPADPGSGQPSGSVGAFVESFLNFLIVGFAVFLVVRAYNALQARHAEPAAEAGASEPQEVVLLREIRDALRSR
ncbi:MAG TPA: large conductance mechanosensitive channel protein MscL [Nitriliruptorales bacterium]|nr:large conductance mechanosensitive channel protein MscL [Nitriliruptorales bacterium]